jgi:hypothetical protein
LAFAVGFGARSLGPGNSELWRSGHRRWAPEFKRHSGQGRESEVDNFSIEVFLNFPITGFLLVLLGGYFFFFAPRMLYLAAVFLIPFSAMAVVNIGWGAGEKGISAWVFMGTLWIVRTAISNRPFWKRAGWKLTGRARIELLVVLGCAFISLLVPMLLNGTAWVEYYRIASDQTIPLRLDAERITQTGYFAFGVVFTILVAVENCDSKRLLQSVRTYILSAIFVSLWGFVQLWCNLTGHAYPAFLFNTSMGTSAQLYTERLAELNLARVSSVAVEPSQLGFSLMLAFVFLLASVALRRPVLTRRADAAALLLVTSALAISTSTTAYLGFSLASIFVVGALIRARSLRWKHAILGAAAVAASILALLSVPLVHDLVDLIVLGKAQTGSGMERINSISLGARYFMQYPLLGTSWNAVNSADLMFEVLSSLGLVGFSALAFFLVDELRRLWRSSVRSGGHWPLVLFPAVCVMLCLSEATGFPFPMGYVWFALGLGVAAPFIIRPKASGAALRTEPSGKRSSHAQSGCPQET